MAESADSIFADAYAYFEQGLCFDEAKECDQKEDALRMYESGLQLAEGALKMKGVEKSSLYAGIVATKARVKERVVELRKAKAGAPIPTAVKENLRNCLTESASKRGEEDAELVYWLPEGVQLVVIENGETKVPTPPCSLAIFRLLPTKNDEGKRKKSEAKGSAELKSPPLPDAFVQVGPWAYPLIVGTTSVLRNEMGIYVVANPTDEHPNMFVGIILPRDLEKRLEDEFLTVLCRYAVVKKSEIVEEMTPEQRMRTSQRISAFLVSSGEMLAENLHRAAGRAGEYLVGRGERYRAGIPVREGAPLIVNPVLRNGVYVLHKGSKGVAKVTKYMLDKIGDMGIALANQMVSGVSTESRGGRLIHSTAAVVGGGITGASTVWMALENASRTLFRNFTHEAVETARCKYGDEASDTMHHALYAVGHTTMVGYQLWDLGPRSVAGRMARKAGIQMVHQLSNSGGMERMGSENGDKVRSAKNNSATK